MASTPSVALGLVLSDMERATRESKRAVFRVMHRNMNAAEGRLALVTDESVILRDAHAGMDIEIQRRHIATIERQVYDKQRSQMVTVGLVFATIVLFGTWFVILEHPMDDLTNTIAFGWALVMFLSPVWLEFTPARRWFVSWELLYPPPGTEVVETNRWD